ncbi:MAG: hypothetical protein L6R39_006599 [Caloplaca ligustica]|nr:MAG: hypothetical protein L6R39_006599 [Caloplaca ligustica]
MVLLTDHFSSLWVLSLLCGTVQGQSEYPNPFAQQPVGGGGSAPPAEYPNPFATQAEGGGSGTSGGTGATASEYPNPFAGGGGGGGSTTTGGSGSTTSGYPNPFDQTGGTTGGSNIASLDPNNPAGTCCCDARKTYQVPTTPQPPGGCCAKGNKWSCSCQDGGSFKYNPLACPVLHRNTRVTPSGPTFDLYCNVQTHRKDIKVEPADTFIECVDGCGALAGCVGVDFDKVAKKCYFKSEFMDENTSGVVNNDIDSATMTPMACPDISKSLQPLLSRQTVNFSIVHPQTSQVDLVCTVTTDGQIRNIGGVDYMVSCGKPITTSTVKPNPDAKTVEACAVKCASMPDCQGMNFRDSDKGCFTHTIYQNRKP